MAPAIPAERKKTAGQLMAGLPWRVPTGVIHLRLISLAQSPCSGNARSKSETPGQSAMGHFALDLGPFCPAPVVPCGSRFGRSAIGLRNSRRMRNPNKIATGSQAKQLNTTNSLTSRDFPVRR